MYMFMGDQEEACLDTARQNPSRALLPLYLHMTKVVTSTRTRTKLPLSLSLMDCTFSFTRTLLVPCCVCDAPLNSHPLVCCAHRPGGNPLYLYLVQPLLVVIHDLDQTAHQLQNLRALLPWINWKTAFFRGSDTEGEVRKKLEIEWDSVPLVNLMYGEENPGSSDARQILVVYIMRFFKDGTDFVYVVRGAEEKSKFLLGTYSGKAYDRPCFAAPVTVYSLEEMIDSPGLDKNHLEETSKTETKGLKWKYLYESGVKAWEQMEFSAEKLNAIQKADAEAIAYWKGNERAEEEPAASDAETQAPQSSPQSSGGVGQEADVRSDYEEDMRNYELGRDGDSAEEDSDDGSNHDGKDEDVFMS
ncbi:hypothetical protein DM02DRAFT_731139 [Periconia macrospinosa]|uniref:Uncharacterized protein n=1 Tax=Periconia macrospinosa TaxID=97972 RepID=A0A2V1DEG7_9PLEO|nr:hypothetical protein DM02DRAFT_731139 [Periconia macrospinosa]